MESDCRMKKLILKLVIFASILGVLLSCAICFYIKSITTDIVKASYNSYGVNVPEKYSKMISADTFHSICVRIQKDNIFSEKFSVDIDRVYLLDFSICVDYTAKYLPYDYEGNVTLNSDFKGNPSYWTVKYAIRDFHLVAKEWIEDPTKYY